MNVYVFPRVNLSSFICLFRQKAAIGFHSLKAMVFLCGDEGEGRLCRVVALKSLPVHSLNALIIPILRGCLQSLFNIPVP